MSIEDRLGNKAEAWIAEDHEIDKRLIGTVISRSWLNDDYEGHPVIEIEEKGTGKAWAFHGFGKVCTNEVEKQNPLPGDTIGVQYLGLKLKKGAPEGSKKSDDSYKDWHIVVEKPAKPVEQPEWEALKGSGDKPHFYDDDPQAKVGVPAEEYEPFPDDDALGSVDDDPNSPEPF